MALVVGVGVGLGLGRGEVEEEADGELARALSKPDLTEEERQQQHFRSFNGV